MKIRPFIGLTSLAAILTLGGLGCSSTPDPGEPGDAAVQNDTGVPFDGAAKDTGTPAVDGGVDAQDVVDSGPLPDADSATPEKDSGADAANGDSGHDGAAPNDAAPDAITPPPQDGGDAGDDGSAGVCTPNDESGFVPTWHGSNAHAASCTQAQMDAYLQCILDGETQASPASCTPFTGTSISAANKACLACILTPDTAATYGAIIAHKGTIEMNQPGCVAIALNDPQGTGCAGHLQGADQCRNAACAANCPVVDDASFNAEQECEQAAGAGTCKTEVDAATCADALVEAGGGPAACVSGQSFADIYNAITPIFCGGL